MARDVSVLASDNASLGCCRDQETELKRPGADIRKRFFSCERRPERMQQEYFELLLQALRKQQQIWEQLKEENWQLRRQLTDLRAAQGLVVVIEGKRFV